MAAKTNTTKAERQQTIQEAITLNELAIESLRREPPSPKHQRLIKEAEYLIEKMRAFLAERYPPV